MLTINQLCERYGIRSRNTLYARIKSLQGKANTTLVTHNGKSCAPQELIEILDDQDRWIRQEGGNLDNFMPVAATSVEVFTGQQDRTTGQDNRTLAPEQASSLFIKELASQIAESVGDRFIPLLPEPDPVKNLQSLECAAQKNYELTTKEVKRLIGVKPIPDHEGAYARGSFVFYKVGRIGRSSAWIVRVKS